jgi:hypothetical protein
MGKRLGAVASLVLATSIVACGGGDSSDPGPLEPGAGPNGGGENGVTIGPDGVPVGPDGKPLSPRLDGKYEIANTFDLTTAGVFPNVVNDTLKALSNFREKPTATIADLADAANVPIVSTVLDIVPGPIKGFVFGWIDEHVFKALYQNVPVTKQLTGMLDDLASLATRFELVSNLDLPSVDAKGNVRAKHTMTGVAYHWSEQRHVITAPELVSKLTEQPVDANAVALEMRSKDLESGRLVLRDHKFSVPVGSFAVYAADALAKDKFGAKNLRDAIGKVVNCKAIADDVANRCIDPIGPGKVCVGHSKEIENFCTMGLDILVGTLQTNLKKLDLPLLRLKEGSAQMWDAPVEGGPLDANVDRLDKGFWTAAVLVGKEEKTILASFTGKRVGESSSPSAKPGAPK